MQATQQILIHCGPASYCTYQVIKRYQAARQLLNSTPLADPAPLLDLLARQIKPLVVPLEKMGAEVPPEPGGVWHEHSSQRSPAHT
jgi:hypothetical protein